MCKSLIIGSALLASFTWMDQPMHGQGNDTYYLNSFDNSEEWVQSFDVIDQYGAWSVDGGTLLYDTKSKGVASLHVDIDISNPSLISDNIVVSLKSGILGNERSVSESEWGLGLRRSQDSEPLLFLISDKGEWVLYKGFAKKELVRGSLNANKEILNNATIEVRLSKNKSKFDFIVKDATDKIILEQTVVEYFDLSQSDALDTFIFADADPSEDAQSIWFDDFSIGHL